MNTGIEEVKIDLDDICNFCNEWDQIKHKYTNFSKEVEENNLIKIKNEIKKNKKKTDYDCIIGLSGGVDSSYATLLAWKLNLNPLIIHMDNGWNSKVSNLNINKILEKTNFDYETLILDWDEFKDLQKSFLKAGVPDIEILSDHAIFAYILNYSINMPSAPGRPYF
jgi:3'-phosphoadenosine 5'-phosphosulfate sulfotransferase (PAPS reductase)/FAD synthetase